MSSTTPSSGSHLGGHPPHPLDAVDSSDTYAVAFNQEQAAAASLPLRLSARNLHGTAVLPLPGGPGNPSSNNNDIAGAHSLSSPYYYPSASAGSYHPSASPPANNEEEEDGDDLASLCSVGTDLEAAGANSHHNPRGGGGNGDKQVVLGRTETRRVRCLRVLVLLILVAAAALCATFVYKYTSADEADNFQVVYQQYSQLVVDTVHRNAQHKLEAVGALVAMVQSYAISSNSTWPFVTVPFFEEHVLVSRSLTDAFGVVLYPIVTDANKEEWEDYSVAHRGWINASYDAQRDTFGEDQGRWPMPNQTWFDALWGDKYRNPNNPNFSSGIGVPIFKTTQPNNPDWHIPVVETFPGPYFPQWQAASMGWYYHMTVNSNYAQFPDFLESTRLVIDTQTAVLGMPWTDPSAPGYISTLLFPVLDAFHGTNKTVTAFLGVDIFWEAYLSRILPPNATGLHVVIESSFGDVFTFELEGDQAVFLGDGDLHETAFNSWAVPTQFGQYVQEASKSDTYTGVPLYDGFYQYNFTIYPSAELQSQYVTNQPVVFTVAILAVFVFTSLVFVAYDCLVERRQKVVLTTAVRSDAIVSSLFPSGVKERLYEQHELQQQQQQQQQPQTFAADDAGHFTQRADEDRTSEWLGLPNPQVTAKEGPPIAELYPHATVLFADIAGFTAWSSSRSPVDVFTMLECLYGSFDHLAKRRGVFKIETIGDCYVAVTGLPTPRDDHALCMAKFARDMMEAWEEQQMRLTATLGTGLLDLGLRVGMHSGPVTAGVLRGDRARFQLFGDTVNTASRMESNGRPMHIHVSQETADLILATSKRHWVKLRDDKIVAKGKGELQTYWVSTVDETRSTSHHLTSNESTTHAEDLALDDDLQDLEKRLKERLEV